MKIFLSHKAEQDAGTAERVKEALEALELQRKSKISVFVSTSDIAAAENWPRKIRRELKEADLLLLLYTDPNFDWAWCMFEAGLYEDLESDPADDNLVTFTGVFTSESYIINRLISPSEYSATVRWQDQRPTGDASDWYYVRVTQHNGQLAWSSPIWVG